jgi:hypothetical protein
MTPNASSFALAFDAVDIGFAFHYILTAAKRLL